MSNIVSKPKAKPTRTLGKKAFAAISAVEGLRLSKSSRERLKALEQSNLSLEERRAEVLRAYVGTNSRK
jgi:hypothetical protein